MNSNLSIVMLGATGAVGSQVVNTLIQESQLSRLTLLGRRELTGISDEAVEQHIIDIFKPSSYQPLLAGHQLAVCTLGVGESSKVSKEVFVKIDKLAVLDFAQACKAAGVTHFSLLSSVAANSKSRSFYLRTKGELEDGLKALNFERLSLFQPSMILTPKNRYGFSQALILKLWPLLKPLLISGLRKYRGIPVAQLGKAIALNLQNQKQGVEILHWDEFNDF